MSRAVLTVISDPICPWCFIGKHRLEQAIKSLPPAIELEVSWNPFELNPTLPKNGMKRTDYLRIKFGSTKAAEKIYKNIHQTAKLDGIKFDFDAISRTPNTRDAHKLILHAKNKGLQNELVTNLFSAYFVRGQDIGDIETILNIASHIGLEPNSAKNVFLDPKMNAEVEKLEEQASSMGIMGVPAFLYNGRYIFSGAQSPETIKLSIIKAHDKNLS